MTRNNYDRQDHTNRVSSIQQFWAAEPQIKQIQQAPGRYQQVCEADITYPNKYRRRLNYPDTHCIE